MERFDFKQEQGAAERLPEWLVEGSLEYQMIVPFFESVNQTEKAAYWHLVYQGLLTQTKKFKANLRSRQVERLYDSYYIPVESFYIFAKEHYAQLCLRGINEDRQKSENHPDCDIQTTFKQLTERSAQMATGDLEPDFFIDSHELETVLASKDQDFITRHEDCKVAIGKLRVFGESASWSPVIHNLYYVPLLNKLEAVCTDIISCAKSNIPPSC